MRDVDVDEDVARYRLRTILYVAAFVAVTVAGAVILLATRSLAGLVVWIALVVVGLLLLVRWHARTFAYRCGHCDNEFQVSPWTDFVSPHWPTREGGWKWLRCPRCGRRTRATIVTRGETGR